MFPFRRTDRLIHEVEGQGKIHFLLNSLIGAYNRRTDVIARGSGDNQKLDAIVEMLRGLANLPADISLIKDKLDLIHGLLTSPQPQVRGTIMADYQVPADQPDGRVTFHISATDSEGNPITDPAELAKLPFEVINSNEAAFAVTMDTEQPDPANRVGGYHVGGPGQGAVTTNLKQADGDIIATGTDGFTVTTGEATLGAVTGTFEGLTPIEPAPEA